MKNKYRVWVGIAFILSLSQFVLAQAVPSDEEIRAILSQRLGGNSDRVGIVVGIIEPAGRRIVAQGSLGKGEKRLVDGDTLFEIGSATKVFTSLLLADMASKGEVSLTDPVAKFLPSGARMPERGGRIITLEDLSRHRSALPRLPSNLDAGKNPENPYANYTVQQLYDFLSGYKLPRDIGAEFEYSNLGAGLLGHALARASGEDYEALVQKRICRPLGMSSTGIVLSNSLKARLSTGNNQRFQPTPNWDLPTLAGAGALRSTANDMLSFLGAHLGHTASNLKPAIQAALEKRTPAGTGMEIGLGWLIRPKKDSEIVWHNGGTGGYRSFIGFDRKARTGVVVLTNVYTVAGVDDLGFHLLDRESRLLPPDSPLLQPIKDRMEISLNPAELDIYVGKYQLIPNVFVTISRKDAQLFAQLTGQGAFEIYPESKTEFFLKVVDAQMIFRTGPQGEISGFTLRQNGQEQFAKKTEGAAENDQEWFGRREKKVDSAIFDRYVGSYQLPNGAVFTVSREGDRIFSQQTGQQKLEIFAESEKVFFVKVFDGQITFESEGTGPATALTIRQNGRDIRAARIP